MCCSPTVSPGEDEERLGEVPADFEQQAAKSKVRNTVFMLCFFLQVFFTCTLLVLIIVPEAILYYPPICPSSNGPSRPVCTSPQCQLEQYKRADCWLTKRRKRRMVKRGWQGSREEKKLAIMMMSKKRKRLYDQIMKSRRSKAREVRELKRKRKEFEERTRTATKRAKGRMTFFYDNHIFGDNKSALWYTNNLLYMFLIVLLWLSSVKGGIRTSNICLSCLSRRNVPL